MDKGEKTRMREREREKCVYIKRRMYMKLSKETTTVE